MATTKKSSAQSSGKLRSLLSRLNPNSPAKKLLAFVLVFAVLGGGYYAYRSFALTGTIVVQPQQMSGGTPYYVAVGPTSKMIERRLSSRVKVNSVVSLPSSSGPWRICVNARDIEGSTELISFHKVYSSSDNNGARTIRSGWYDTGLSVQVGARHSFEISGNSRAAIRQVAYVQKMGACPR